MRDDFVSLGQMIANIRLARPMGRIGSIDGGVILVEGLERDAALGDRVSIGRDWSGEVIGLRPKAAIVQSEQGLEGLSIGLASLLEGPTRLAPSNGWIGRILDPLGRPLDGRPLLPGPVWRRLQGAPPAPARRRRLGQRLSTGKAVFDTILPITRGQRIGLFAGSGVGKSGLLGSLARGVTADVVVVALVGERGREVRDFTEGILGPAGLARSVVVAATSDQSPLLRRRCLYSAITIAEHFRDQGKHVLLLADSVTRFADAHREITLAAGETSSLRGFPPSLQHAIMALAERAGPGLEGLGPSAQGDITAIFSVLVAGSDMEEPVADIMRGVLDGHIVLDRRIAERGRFPAIDVLRSVSRSLPSVASADENAMISKARAILSAWDRTELMVQAGLYQKGSDALIDSALKLWPLLDQFISEDAPVSGIGGSFSRLAQCLNE